VGLNFLEPLMANGPWAAVLVICAPMAAIVIMFVCAMVLVPKNMRVEAINAMAELVRAIRPGGPKRLP
jgi:hypothetical protein